MTRRRFLTLAIGAAAAVPVASLMPAPALAENAGRAVEMTPPLPDWDNPRKILLQVTSNEPGKFEGAMSNAMNLRKFYGPDQVELAIITYGAGVRHLLAEKPTAADRISSLQKYDIAFVTCGNTLDTIGKGEDDLVPGITVVSTGIAEVVERELRGWVTIVP